jgi:hypothetical protein
MCFCGANADNLMVSLELIQDYHKFATENRSMNMVMIVSVSEVNGLQEEPNTNVLYQGMEHCVKRKPRTDGHGIA